MSATVQTSFKQKIVDSVEIPVLTRCCFCFPLRKGLISFAYFNLVMSIVVSVFVAMYVFYFMRNDEEVQTTYARQVFDFISIILEMIMTVLFIVALHKKHVLMMRVYLYFEVVFSIIGFVYSLAFLSKETAGELFLILFQISVQIYLGILIWSSIVKMERDGVVKYVRERDPV